MATRSSPNAYSRFFDLAWRLRVPALAIVLLQFGQHVYAGDYSSFKTDEIRIVLPFLVVSLLKVTSFCLLSFYFARALEIGDSKNVHESRLRKSEWVIFTILMVNIALAVSAFTFVRFISSPQFETLETLGVSKGIAKAVFFVPVLLLLLKMNDRVFRDISSSLCGPNFAADLAKTHTSANRSFLAALLGPLVRYSLPCFLAHLLISAAIARTSSMFVVLAALDTVAVTALALSVGYAMQLAYRKVTNALSLTSISARPHSI